MNTAFPAGDPPPDTTPRSTVLLNASAIRRALTRIAHEIAERNDDSGSVVLLGIQAGGAPLARRLAAQLEIIWGHPVPQGAVDISMHRDDLHGRATPRVHLTDIPCDIDGRTVVLVDDVVFSGRSVRAAMDALHGFGRPARIQLAALVDRGHRDLPIKADFIGKNVPTARAEKVVARFQEIHGVDEVVLERGGDAR